MHVVTWNAFSLPSCRPSPSNSLFIHTGPCLWSNTYRLSLLSPSILPLPLWSIRPKLKLLRGKTWNGTWVRLRPWKPKRTQKKTSTAPIPVPTLIPIRKNPSMSEPPNRPNRRKQVRPLLLLLSSVRYPAQTRSFCLIYISLFIFYFILFVNFLHFVCSIGYDIKLWSRGMCSIVV